MHESFRNLARDVFQLVSQPLVLRVLLMFILPCAAFTLTNAFGGMGPDFHAADNLVSVANGIGAVVIGLSRIHFGSSSPEAGFSAIPLSCDW